MLLTSLAPTAQAFEAFDGRIQAHGFFESQLRAMNSNFGEDWDVTQWYNIFNLEMEFDIAPDGVGPLDLLQAYVRAEVRYDCIYTRGCGVARSINAYGDRSKSLPRRLNGGHIQLGSGGFPRASAIASNGTDDGKGNVADGDPGVDRRNGTKSFTGERLSGGSTDPVSLRGTAFARGLFQLSGADGIVGTPTFDCNPINGLGFDGPIGGDNCDRYAGGVFNSTLRLRGDVGAALDVPGMGPLLNLNSDDPAAYLFESFEDFRFAQIDRRGGSGNGRPIQVLGPWLPENKVNPIATLADRVNPFDSSRTSPVVAAAVFNNTLNNEYERRLNDNVIAMGGPMGRQTTLRQATEVATDALEPPVPGRSAFRTRGIFYGRNALQDTQAANAANPGTITANNIRRAVPFPRGAGGRGFRPIPYADEGQPGIANDIARGIYYPTQGLKDAINSGDLEPTWLLNLNENRRAWNRGFSQKDEKELKEAYFDIEMLDSRLWLRIGRQQIVWGKTELFRTTDQFNPTDVGLASLPSLEESRIALWAFRSVYSLYEVGPLEDVRLEFAFNYDQITPVDLGACGEPYVVNVVCTANFGAFAHGLTGIGVAGVDIPDSPWSGAEGWEVGARIEFRWDRFSFAISDYWGYDDFPFLDRISTYERNVDPNTGRGRPMASRDPCVRNDNTSRRVGTPFVNAVPASDAAPATGVVEVGRDPGCLRPGVSNREVRPTGFAFAGFATRDNNEYRSNPVAIAGTNAVFGPFAIAAGDTRRSPSSNDFDPALISYLPNGDAERNPFTNQLVPATQIDPSNALDASPANLQIFSFICAATVGFSSLDPTACAQTVFGSTALASQNSPGLGGVSRVLANVLGGSFLASEIAYPLAGSTLPVVAMSRDSDTPVQFFAPGGGALGPGSSAQEGVYIATLLNPLVTINPGVLANISPTTTQLDGSSQDRTAAQSQPFAFGPAPGSASPWRRNRFRDLNNPTLPASHQFSGAVWLGSRENVVPFYASCTYSDFRGFIRNCDQDYRVGSGASITDPDTINDRLTAQQEALLGCGPFWGTSCDEQGIDLLNMEASVLLQSFPGLDGTGTPAGQDAFTSGGQWRTDGLEPGAPVQVLNAFQVPPSSHFAFSGQVNSEGDFEPIPDTAAFLTDAQLTASGRPERYSQPGTLDFVVANAAYNQQGERLDYTCTTGDIGGSETSILPGCRTKWKDRVDGTLNLFGIDLQCRQDATVDGVLDDPRCVAGTDENREIIANATHLSLAERNAILRRPKGGAYLGGDENFRADARSWDVSVDGDPDRLGFDGFGAYNNVTQRIRSEVVFRTRDVIFFSPAPSLDPNNAAFFTPSLTRGAGHPFTGQAFANELAAFSWNFLTLVTATSASYQVNAFDPDAAGASPGGLSGQGNPLAYSTFDPVNPLNASMVAAMAELQTQIAALNPVSDAARIADLEGQQREQAALTQPICSFITPQSCETVAALMGIAGQKRNDVRAGGNGRFGRRTFIWHGGGEVVIKFNKRNVLGFGMDFAEDYTKSNWGLESTWIQGIPTFDPNEVDNFTRTDTYNLTLSVDRPTFINFLNPNRTFFITTQWFFQYRDGYHKEMGGHGPWNILGILAINTGYFQDRLLPSLLLVYDVMSASGAIIPSFTYRFDENFSATIGIAGFWGRTESSTMSINEIGPPANRSGNLRYNDTVETGLALVRSRDEVFLRLRYTF